MHNREHGKPSQFTPRPVVCVCQTLCEGWTCLKGNIQPTFPDRTPILMGAVLGAQAAGVSLQSILCICVYMFACGSEGKHLFEDGVHG